MNLYRTRTLAASLLLLFLGCACVLVLAQRRTAHKLRAIGVVEVNTDRAGHTVAHVIPVAILEDGRFHDASIYKAHPKPLAVDDGVVYEVQKTGNPVGFVTLAGAAQTGGIWTALGKWQPIVASAKSEPSASPAPSAGSSASADGRPILHRSGDSGSPSSNSTPEASPQAPPDSQSGSTSSSGSGSGSGSSGDSDRPVLHRPNSSGDSGSNSPSASPQSSPQA